MTTKGEKFATLGKTRQYIRQRVTKIYQQVTTPPGENLDAVKRATYRENLVNFRTQLSSLDQEIFSYFDEKDEENSNRIKTMEEYEEKIQEALSKLEVSSTPPVFELAEINNKVKLPNLELPTFSNGKSESLSSFFFTFESIMNKYKMTSYEKFLYLKMQLLGSAKLIVESLDIQE